PGFQVRWSRENVAPSRWEPGLSSSNAMTIRQSGPGEDEPADEGEPGQGARAGGRRRPGSGCPHDRADRHERPECDQPRAVEPPRGAQVERDRDPPKSAFDDESSWNRAPQSEPEPGRGARPERHVGGMRDEVEHPVAEHEQSEKHRGPWWDPSPACKTGEGRTPDAAHEQAVRPWVGIEDERREGRRAGDDSNPLPSEQQEDWPEQVGRTDRRHEPAERDGRRSPLPRERQRKKYYEHCGGRAP